MSKADSRRPAEPAGAGVYCKCDGKPPEGGSLMLFTFLKASVSTYSPGIRMPGALVQMWLSASSWPASKPWGQPGNTHITGTCKFEKRCFRQRFQVLHLDIPKRSMGRIQGIQELGRQNVTSLLCRARSPAPTWDSVANGKDAGSCQVTGLLKVLKQHFLPPSFQVVAVGRLARSVPSCMGREARRLLYNLIFNRPDNSISTHLVSSAALRVFILSVYNVAQRALGITGATRVLAWRGAEGSWRALAELVPRQLPPALGPGHSLPSSAPLGPRLHGGVCGACGAWHKQEGASWATQGAPGPALILARHAAVPRSSWVLGWYLTSSVLIITWS